MMRSHPIPPVIAAAVLMVFASGCERSTDGLRPFPLSTDPTVFTDAFDSGVQFQAFSGSKLDALSIDSIERHNGTASLKLTVPPVGDPSGSYAGGAFVANVNRDLSGYDAVTFWARASQAITFDVAGLGNDNTGTSRFTAQRNAIPMTTTWTRYVVPIPLPARLNSERGLFFVAEGPENGMGFDVWFDDIQFEKTNAISNPRPAMASRTVNSFVGASVAIANTQTTFNVSGTDLIVGHLPSYFDFSSSNSSVAVARNGVIQVIGAGSTMVTGQLGTTAATGSVTINATAPPATPAATPTVPAPSVISLLSRVYPSVPVDTWSATWDLADVSDLQIAGNPTKVYTNLVYAGVEFITHTINANQMTAIHLDVFQPSGTTFKVKLVDFGANNVYGGGDDAEQELTFNSGTTPALIPGTWSALEIPLANFTNLTSRANLAQLVLSGAGTAFVENVYFHE